MKGIQCLNVVYVKTQDGTNYLAEKKHLCSGKFNLTSKYD